MNDDEIQKLIEDSLKEASTTVRSNKEEELYQTLFNELNDVEDVPIPYHFSNKVTREAIKIQTRKEKFYTKVKVTGIILTSLLLASIIFKIFNVNIDSLTTLPISYYIYGVGAIITFLLIEVADYVLLDKN